MDENGRRKIRRMIAGLETTSEKQLKAPRQVRFDDREGVDDRTLIIDDSRQLDDDNRAKTIRDDQGSTTSCKTLAWREDTEVDTSNQNLDQSDASATALDCS